MSMGSGSGPQGEAAPSPLRLRESKIQSVAYAIISSGKVGVGEAFSRAKKYVETCEKRDATVAEGYCP